MGDSLSSLVSPLTDVAQTALKAVEDPLGALLPEAEGLLSNVSSIFTDGLVKRPQDIPAPVREVAEPLLQSVAELPHTKGTTAKREAILRVIEDLMDALEVED
jgi:hypothetical protein